MTGFVSKKSYKVRRELTDKDFRHFAKQIAYEWAEFYATTQKLLTKAEIRMLWTPIEDITSAARFWSILNSELIYDLSVWLQESAFVGNLPQDIVKEYESRFQVNSEYIGTLPETAPKRYCYEQYFVYREICKVLGVDYTVTDEE